MTAHISSLQENVDQLFANLNSLRSQVDAQSLGSVGTPFNPQDYPRSLSIGQTPILTPSPAHQRSKSISKHPRFHGPTSSAFNLGVAKSSLKTMGITGPEEGDDEGVITQDVTPTNSPPAASVMLSKQVMHADKDPIWSLNKREAIRLVHVWQEEMGMMYPFLNIDNIVRYADMLFSFVEAAARAGLMQHNLPGADAIMDDQTSILKLILAISLILEGRGKDPLGERLFENVHKIVDRTLSDPVDLRGINMLALTVRPFTHALCDDANRLKGMYHFHRDDEALAWRIIGMAARQCLELGLHRRETYLSVFIDPEEQAAAIRTFWSVYVLDRRWSFGTGMPFALQDQDIDPNLPKPVSSTSRLAYEYNVC
jgi:hypothetical protein